MMSGREDDRVVALQLSASAAVEQNDELPFTVELWDEPASRVERVIARASSGQLARAIFASARKEFPGRRITLRRGSERVLDSAE